MSTREVKQGQFRPLSVSISTIPSIVASDTRSAFEGQLESELGLPVVRSEHEYRGPTAEFSDIATVVSFAADVVELTAFFGGVLTAAFKRKEMIQRFRDLIEGGMPSKITSPPAFPVQVNFGTIPEHASVRFYFHGHPSDIELIKAWETAREILLSLPPEAFRGLGGPPLVGYFWDYSAQRWRGTTYYEAHMTGDGYTVTWFPPDFPPVPTNSEDACSPETQNVDNRDDEPKDE